MQCPLCFHSKSSIFYSHRRDFYRCDYCKMIFADPQFFLTSEKERARYELHQSDKDDKDGHAQFLSRIIDKMEVHIAFDDSKSILDFGCGPFQKMKEILSKRGLNIDCYDPFFAGQASDLPKTYELVFATEVVEHFKRPNQDWRYLTSFLKKDGWLGIITQPYVEGLDFAKWWYKNDPTHVAFYSNETWDLICSEFGLQIIESEKDIFIFKKL